MRAIIPACVLLAAVPEIGFSGDLFHCGNWLVSAEMSAADLQYKCGTPASRAVSTQDLRDEYGVKVGTLTTEIWRYDASSSRVAMKITLVDGQIQSIERGH